MLPEQIQQRILSYYSPGTIENYDQLISLADFSALFAEIENVSDEQLKKELIKIGFTDENRVDELYFINQI